MGAPARLKVHSWCVLKTINVGVPLILAISLILKVLRMRTITAWMEWRLVRIAVKLWKESPPLLTSPADPCTSAANDSVQQVSNGKRQGRHHHALY